jgi:hypothetical protein
MRKTIITIGFAVLLISGSANALESKTFNSDGNIMPNEQWNAVSIYDTSPAHTTVNMSGGNVLSIFTYDASTLNMTGGSIDHFNSYEYSKVNITGGLFDGLTAREHSIVTFSGNSEALNVHSLNDSTININGGTIRWLDADNDGIINIYGGNLTEVWTNENAIINIFGHHDLIKYSSGGMNGYGFVQGYYNNLSWFRFDFSSAETYSHVNLIPEPTAILLLGAGGLFLRKKN